MKKITTLFLSILILSSCLDNKEELSFDFQLVPIDSFTIPDTLTFDKIDTIKVKYSLRNGCYSFNNIYYEPQDTTRIIAIRALVELDKDCTLAIIEEERNILVKPNQTEDYVFKFWKGTDENGENIFDEVIVPVN